MAKKGFCSLLTSLILGLYYKLNWPKRASAVYWLLGTLLYPWTGDEEAGGVLQEGGQVAEGEVSSVSAAQGNAGASDSSLVSVWRETCVDDNSNEGYFSCDEGECESVVPPQNGSGGGGW